MFSEDDDCIYIFDWETKYACIEHPLGEDCDVSYGGKNYDLSRLVRISGKTEFIYLHLLIIIFKI